MSSGHIDCVFESEGFAGRFTGFYGHPETSQRRYSWELLRKLHSVPNFGAMPWILGGDFNEILYAHEKVGGNIRLFSQMKDFREALEECNLNTIPGADSGWTWSSRRGDGLFVKEKLDRFLVNMEILNGGGNLCEKVLDNYGSDHRALELCFQPRNVEQKGSGKRRFFFEDK